VKGRCEKLPFTHLERLMPQAVRIQKEFKICIRRKPMEPVFADRKSVLDYAERTFGTLPDYPWLKDPKSAVLRHQDTAKWYGLIMEIPPKRLGLSGQGAVDILNIKCDPLVLGGLIDYQRYFPAYHMNKEKWVSAILNGTIPQEELFSLLRQSFALTKGK